MELPGATGVWYTGPEAFGKTPAPIVYRGAAPPVEATIFDGTPVLAAKPVFADTAVPEAALVLFKVPVCSGRPVPNATRVLLVLAVRSGTPVLITTLVPYVVPGLTGELVFVDTPLFTGIG